MGDGDSFCGHHGGRRFPPIKSLRMISGGFFDAPSGPSIALAFVMVAGVEELSSSAPDLAAVNLRLLRRCVRGCLRNSKGSGYECQEINSTFMLAFAGVNDAIAFGSDLMASLPRVSWTSELRAFGPEFKQGLQVS